MCTMIGRHFSWKNVNNQDLSPVNPKKNLPRSCKVGIGITYKDISSDSNLGSGSFLRNKSSPAKIDIFKNTDNSNPPKSESKESDLCINIDAEMTDGESNDFDIWYVLTL